MLRRRTAAVVLLAGAALLAGFALVRAFDNPDVAWSGEGDYQCSAPWDTALNSADNFPGGEPPADGDIVATRCRDAGYASFEQAYVAGMGALGLLVLAAAAAVAGSAGRRGVVLGAAAGVVAVGAVAGLGWAGWERQHPTAFADNGSSLSFDALPAGKTVYVAVNWPDNPDHDVVLERAVPRVTTDTAVSDVEVVVCVPDASSVPIGSSYAKGIHRFCEELVPIWPDEPDVTLSSTRRDQLLIGVTTSRPGRIDVAGIDLVYRDGWRRGRQVVAAHVKTSTPAR